MKRSAIVGLTIIIAISLLFSTLIIHSLSVSANVDPVATAGVALTRSKIRFFKANITLIADSYIIANDSIKLITGGRWLVISNNLTAIQYWSKVKSYIDDGLALLIIASITRNGRAYNVLLGLRQNSKVLLRPALIKCCKLKYLHGAVEFTCKLIGRRGFSLLVEKKGFKALILLNPNGKWRRAGNGDVYWRDVVNEFNIGDTLWICTHNILILKPVLAKFTGVNALIWGFSGAIIDLSNGLALAKHPL